MRVRRSLRLALCAASSALAVAACGSAPSPAIEWTEVTAPEASETVTTADAAPDAVPADPDCAIDLDALGDHPIRVTYRLSDSPEGRLRWWVAGGGERALEARYELRDDDGYHEGWERYACPEWLTLEATGDGETDVAFDPPIPVFLPVGESGERAGTYTRTGEGAATTGVYRWAGEAISVDPPDPFDDAASAVRVRSVLLLDDDIAVESETDWVTDGGRWFPARRVQRRELGGVATERVESARLVVDVQPPEPSGAEP